MTLRRRYRKRRAPKRTTRRFRRKYSRRRPGKTIGKLTDNTSYRFKRTTFWSPTTFMQSSATVDTFGSFLFRLDQLPDYAEFTNLFDSYKITGIKLRFMPRVTENSTNSQSYGVILYGTDYDDAVVPTNINELMERQSTKVIQAPNRMFSVFIRPKYGTAPVGGYGQSSGGWLDTTSPGVSYYGFKWAWTRASLVATCDIYATYYLKFKSVK